MQNKMIQPLVMAVFAMMLLIPLISCTSMKKKDSVGIERLLVDAGFEKHLADTPEKIAKLEAMTQRKLIHYQHESKDQYVYADAKYCRCLYTGTEEAYHRYQKLALQKQIADEQRTAEERNQPAKFDEEGFSLTDEW